jgi:chromate reductase, NAD(P)H dehydrogenase (quinone)
MKLLGIVGSLRPGSYNAQLMRAVASRMPEGVELEIYEGLRDVPPFDEEDREAFGAPAPVEAFRTALAEADGILFATPEYNGSIPGQLKNALDWASVPFEHNVLRNKPVAVIGTSTGMFGAVWAQAELRKVLGLIGARVLDRDTPVPLAETAFAPNGALDPDYEEAVDAAVADLIDLVRDAQLRRLERSLA